MRSSEPLSHELDFVGIESPRGEGGRTVSTHQPVEDFVGFGVADSEISLVCLTLDQIG